MAWRRGDGQEREMSPGMTDIERELLAYIETLPVIDTHEHMLTEADFIAGQWHFGHVMNYLGLDLGLAGMPSGPWGASQMRLWSDTSVDAAWRRARPYWVHVRTGVYGRAYRRALQRFFAVDDLDDRTVHTVTERLADYQRPGVYDEWLHGRYRIRTMLRVQGNTPAPEPEHFVPVAYLDPVAGIFNREELEAQFGSGPPAEADGYLAVVRQWVRTALDNGAVAIKIGMTARRRPLDFQEHPPEAVQASWEALREGGGDWLDPVWRAALKPCQDAAYWAAFAAAGDLGLPVQVHTGLEFPQPWDGRPTCLIPTLIRFPDTRFALFHGSYPHMAELTGLAKAFPNVYLDLAWFHLLSRYEARRWLAEWLDVLPHNKLFAFGGDTFLFFEACTHLELARENVAAALADRVAGGLCDRNEAEETARRLLHDNPAQTFGLEA